MNRILILCVFVLQVSYLFATGSSCDIIYIDGEKWFLMDKPLIYDSILYRKLLNFLPKERNVSTANWDGYTAYWMVRDEKLYLEKIEVDLYKKQEGKEYVQILSADTLKSLFPSYCDDKGIYAGWFSGKMRSGRGKNIRYIHMSFDRNMEEECVMAIRNGSVIRKQFYHNFKKEGFALREFPKVLEKNFPFKQFPELANESIVFYFRNFKLSPEGHFLDCTIYIESDKSRNWIEDPNHPIIKALKAVLKSIYPWEVLCINGKYTMEYLNFPIYLRYPELRAHTRSEHPEAGDPVCYLNAYKDTVIPFGKYRYYNSDTIRHIGFVLNKGIVCIDHRGNELFDVFTFDNGADTVKEGLFRIEGKDGKIGFADTLGNVVIQPQFAFAFPFEDGKAKVTFSGKKSFVDEQKEYCTWESDYWFYINHQGDFVTDNLQIRSVREYVESNEFIPIIPEEYFKNCLNYVYSDEEEHNLNNQMQASIYRFYKHCSVDDKGIITCHITSGKEINITEELFELRMKDLKSYNKEVEKYKREELLYKLIRLDDDYFNRLLEIDY